MFFGKLNYPAHLMQILIILPILIGTFIALYKTGRGVIEDAISLFGAEKKTKIIDLAGYREARINKNLNRRVKVNV